MLLHLRPDIPPAYSLRFGTFAALTVEKEVISKVLIGSFALSEFEHLLMSGRAICFL